MIRSTLIFLSLGIVAGCASGPSIRSDYDRSADFSAYRTYGFATELGTDKAGYSTLVTGHFKTAISRELEARGYRLDAANPDLIVNFNTTVRQQTDVRSTPTTTVGVGVGMGRGGYYGYRGGLYSSWPAYTNDVSTVHYQVGTANVDVVDAKRKQMVWEGVAEGKLTDKVLADPKPAIDAAITEIFTRYPASAGAAATAPAG